MRELEHELISDPISADQVEEMEEEIAQMTREINALTAKRDALHKCAANSSVIHFRGNAHRFASAVLAMGSSASFATAPPLSRRSAKSARARSICCHACSIRLLIRNTQGAGAAERDRRREEGSGGGDSATERRAQAAAGQWREAANRGADEAVYKVRGATLSQF